MDVHFFQYYLLKRLFFLHWIIFASLSEINWPYLYLDSVLLCWSMCLSLDQLDDLDYREFKSIFKIYIIILVSVMPLTLIFFRIVLGILVPLPFPIDFRIGLSIYQKILLEFLLELF